MKVTWNGTGAAWSYRYGNASAVIEAEGTRLLFDCGHTVPARLHEMGYSLHDMDAVFITHLHGDHIYGLEEWGFRSLLVWKYRPKLFISETLSLPLWRQVFSGTMAMSCDRHCLLRDFFDVTLMEPEKTYEIGALTLELRPVHHVRNVPAFGAKVRHGETAVGFTGDSLAEGDSWFFEDSAAVFHDCAFYPYVPDTVHAHYEQLKQYPEDFRRKMFLVHYGDDMEERFADEAWRAEFEATGMRLARPFETLEFPAP